MRRRKSRRECSSPSSMRSTRRSRDGSLIWGLLGDDKGVLGLPAQQHVPSGTEAAAALGVLLEDGELLAALGADEVLDRHAEERGQRDLAAQAVDGGVGRRALGGDERDLLGTDAGLEDAAVGLRE